MNPYAAPQATLVHSNRFLMLVKSLFSWRILAILGIASSAILLNLVYELQQKNAVYESVIEDTNKSYLDSQKLFVKEHVMRIELQEAAAKNQP